MEEEAAGASLEGVGSCRRELKEDMNSIHCGESPRRALKCSAASCFVSVEAYSRTCWSSSSGRGRSRESCERDIVYRIGGLVEF